MKASEHREVEILGRLQAALEVLDDAAPLDKEVRALYHEAHSLVRRTMLAQWELTSSFVESDDT